MRAAVLVCIACLCPRLAALAAPPQGQLAADGVTILDAPGNGTPSVATAGVDGPGCADLVYFEENGGATGGRGLYDFISAAGTSTLRTAVGGAERLFSLAAAPGGTVFGVDPLADKIYLVDLTTGTLTFLVSLVGTSTVADITFDPVSGLLYGSERNAPLRLYTIDLGTGVATTIGTMLSARSGLTFAPDGTLYGCALNGTLYRIDPLTATETLVGGGGGPTLVEDATVRSDGRLFVTDFGGGLYSIDPATGAIAPVGNSGLGSGLLGIVPEPLAVAAVESVRLGTPPNPMALVPGISSGPLLGATWDPAIDHSSFFPGALIDVLGLSTTAVNVPSPFGTLLCNPIVLLAGPAGAPFPLALPPNCAFAGFPICAQGASTDGVSILLTNALDVVVGSF
ncbi:MAG TPA: hypothetical protein VFZ65_03435 [Planctomycetota bacterium]|nr:hypothetical protein [Planctomycetota bacterium]